MCHTIHISVQLSPHQNGELYGESCESISVSLYLLTLVKKDKKPAIHWEQVKNIMSTWRSYMFITKEVHGQLQLITSLKKVIVSGNRNHFLRLSNGGLPVLWPLLNTETHFLYTVLRVYEKRVCRALGLSQCTFYSRS